MNKNRLEAHSDGVIAIIITNMLLELKVLAVIVNYPAAKLSYLKSGIAASQKWARSSPSRMAALETSKFQLFTEGSRLNIFRIGLIAVLEGCDLPDPNRSFKPAYPSI